MTLPHQVVATGLSHLLTVSAKLYIVTIIEEEKQGKKDVSLEISFNPSKKVEQI